MRWNAERIFTSQGLFAAVICQWRRVVRQLFAYQDRRILLVVDGVEFTKAELAPLAKFRTDPGASDTARVGAANGLLPERGDQNLRVRRATFRCAP